MPNRTFSLSDEASAKLDRLHELTHINLTKLVAIAVESLHAAYQRGEWPTPRKTEDER